MELNIEDILKLSQSELLGFCYMELIKRKYKIKDIEYTDDYVYAKGNIPVLLVAHADIVHKDLPELIVNDRQQRILWSPTGIGGDDRCGVYGILKICEKFKPYVLITTDEEIGGVGVRKFTSTHNKIPVNFIIEIDRRGYNQVVFYQCGNEEFQKYMLSFGLDKQTGSYSDVSTLSIDFDIAGCNLSAGYYNEHTAKEYIVMEHLEHTIDVIKQILADKENHKKYDCQKIEYKWEKSLYDYDKKSWYDYYDYYDYVEGQWKSRKKKEDKIKKLDMDAQNDADFEAAYLKLLQIEEDWYELTDAEWKEYYGTDKPKNIIDIYDELEVL